LFGCQSDRNEILCSEQSVNRLLLASAWLAAHDAQQLVWLNRRTPSKQIVEEVGILDFYGALRIADALNNNDSSQFNSLLQFHRLSKDLPDLVTQVQRGETDPDFHPSDPAAWTAGPIYAVASSELVALILGHEFTHAMGVCHLDALSLVERSGKLKELQDMQAKGMGFVRNLLSQDEIIADQCALRVLEQVDAGWVELCNGINDPSSRSAAKTKTSMGRWIALDAFAALLANSLSRRSNSGPEDAHPGLYRIGPERELMPVDSQASEGYLYSASRLALVALTLHERQASDDPRYKTVLCGAAGREFLAMLHIAANLRENNKSPVFANLFGTIVAPGIAAGLRTGVWHNETSGSSYACPQ